MVKGHAINPVNWLVYGHTPHSCQMTHVHTDGSLTLGVDGKGMKKQAECETRGDVEEEASQVCGQSINHDMNYTL